MCAGHSLLPGSLHFELRDHPTDVAPSHGGFAVVSKREYRGKKVAVKVLQLRKDNDLQVLSNVRYLQILLLYSCWLTGRNIYRGFARRS